MSSTSGEKGTQRNRKQIILIRHGCSYMNEYIGANGISFGGPNFTDIFSEEDHETYYKDSPLSPTGQDQAKALHNDIDSLLQKECDNNNLKESLLDLELVVVSPLTRAIQTAKLALLPHTSSSKQEIPVVALPLAAERLYLASDIGKPRSELGRDYGSLVDFETGFPANLQLEDPWWYQHPSSDRDYEEWRPAGKYFCPGEPRDAFHQRMANLCQWLDERNESTIALVGHFGVFEWLLQDDDKDVAVKFGNCEMRVVAFETILQNTKSRVAVD